MPVLKNARYEQFAQALAKGSDLTSAYVLVGYKKSYQNASRLAQHDEVRTRVNEILTRKDEGLIRAETRAVNAAAVNDKWIMQRLVSEAETAKFASERIKALELVGKQLGMFVNRTEVGEPGSFDNLDSTQAILDQVRKELGAEYANAMSALLEARRPKVIEHQQSESDKDSDIVEG